MQAHISCTADTYIVVHIQSANVESSI